MPHTMTYTKGVTPMENAAIDTAINAGAGNSGTAYKVQIHDETGAEVETYGFTTEPEALERAAERTTGRVGYVAHVWGLLHTLVEPVPES
jgi:hypothetical protein